MIRILELLISLIIVVVVFVLIGVMLPAERKVTHTIETNYPARMVFDLMNGFRRFPEWHPLRSHDPSMNISFEGPERGVGAKLVFDSRDPKVGQGSYEIITSEDVMEIAYAIENPARGENKLAVVEFDDRGKTVEVKWTYTVEYGWDLMGRYAGLYVDRTAGDDIKLALGQVGGLLATMPRFDYSSIDVAYEQVAPQHVLYASLKTKRNITAVEEGMTKAITQLRKALADNRLEAAGPVRLITTNFGSDEYEFDVAIPFVAPENAQFVDPNATADAAGEAADAQPAAEALPGMEPKAPTLPMLAGLNLPEGVMQGASYGGNALTTRYQGHPAALPLLRDQLRAYAATHGEVIQDRAFEEYLTDIETTAAEEAEFKIYWPIKESQWAAGQLEASAAVAAEQAAAEAAEEAAAPEAEEAAAAE
ncbi:SRPBCC family protein [Pseudomarimonas arenosa]|uniref:SRPBCC family protein n=1 Tax=Pseudomarimonas arenosa TaxID=2774145 RepID=A0AAW3ZFL2_9GAMM|nr:SRPBCC family protein [Pseudomarimonas arenosa]MBD8524678.1 SRPBCC family protein [Pseudomarimonas arenosa]